MLTSQVQDARADDTNASKAPLAGRNAETPGRPRNPRPTDRAFLGRLSEYPLPHQRGTVDTVSLLSGNDNCPGTAIPGGNYTAAAPYTDTGNTTGANNTVNHAYWLYYWYYSYQTNGPDNVYSFTLTGLGPNPQIELSTSSGTYKPMIYVLRGDGVPAPCPAGTGNDAFNELVIADSRWGSGNTASLDSWAFGQYYIPLNVPLYLFVDSGLNDAAGSGAYTLHMKDVTVAPSVPATRRSNDFDADGKTDVAIFRPSNGQWWIKRSSDGIAPAFEFGTSTDLIVPGDYTGDGKTDIAIWRPSTGFWFILRSEDNLHYGFPFGMDGDVPVPGDYDGDSKTDAAVFRPSTATWYICKSSGGTTIQSFGLPEDKPVVADYDGDGKTDIAIFRPSIGQWWIQRSSDGVVPAFQFGLSTDKPVQGDYTGDGKADIAVWRPSTGFWYVLRSEDSQLYGFPWGLSTDVPTPGDYDGDGKMDASIFRPSAATWYVDRSTAGVLIQQFGVTTDLPVPSAYVP